MSFYFFGLGEARAARLCLHHNDIGNCALTLLMEMDLVQQIVVVHANCKVRWSRLSIAHG